MEVDQFDMLARSVAHAHSRRSVLKTLGRGGALAGLGAALVCGPAALAQGTPCTLAFVGTVRLGPSAGQILAGGTTPGELRGQLTFTADQSGAIAQGQLQLTNGTAFPVVGQLTGRAINLRLKGAANQVIVAVGTAEQDLMTCQGAVDGLLTGPQLGDLGDWHATLSGSATGGAATMTTSGGNPPTGSMTPTPQPTTTATAPAKPTATTPPPPTTTTTPPLKLVCPLCQTLSNGVCVPAADNTPCGGGNLCCHQQCYDTRGFDTDPANCGSCGHACPAGQFCSNGVCGTCAQLGDRCGVNGDCCSGFCNQGSCDQPPTPPILPTTVLLHCASGQALCNGSCVDTSSDPNNCGTCGNVCPSAPLVGQLPCVNGACT